jgi:hypothetical protein
MTKVRKHIMLEDTSKNGISWEWLRKYMNENDIATFGDGLQHLFAEYQSLKQQVSDRESLAKAIAKEIKPQLDPIRIRTGYVDKNVRVLLNLLNSYIIINGMEDSLPVTDVVAESVRNTQKQVADQIHAYQVARKDKLTRAAAGEDDA